MLLSNLRKPYAGKTATVLVADQARAVKVPFEQIASCSYAIEGATDSNFFWDQVGSPPRNLNLFFSVVDTISSFNYFI